MSDITLFCRDIKLVGWHFVLSSILIFFHTFSFMKLVFCFGFFFVFVCFFFYIHTSIMFKTSTFLAEKNLCNMLYL